MPGNQNSKKGPNRNLKGTSQAGNDTKTVNGAEVLANPMNLQIWGIEGADSNPNSVIDINYGLPGNAMIAGETTGPETQGNQGWSKANPLGTPFEDLSGEDEGPNSNPYGGGFEQ